jgi:hypothetical protein
VAAGEVVLLVHGIRTHADWQEKVKEVLEEAPGVVVYGLKYGFFSAVAFWLPFGFRWAPVKKLAWRLDHARGLHPNAAVSVIAHSYGTYAVIKLLERRPYLTLHRLVLCGSILPCDYRWDERRHQIETEVINDYGSRDPWPVVAQSVTVGYGASGTYGFGTPGVRDRRHPLGHSDFLDADFARRFWLPWFRHGSFVKPAPAPRRIGWWSPLPYLRIKWLAALALTAGGLWWYWPQVSYAFPPLGRFARHVRDVVRGAR